MSYSCAVQATRTYSDEPQKEDASQPVNTSQEYVDNGKETAGFRQLFVQRRRARRDFLRRLQAEVKAMSPFRRSWMNIRRLFLGICPCSVKTTNNILDHRASEQYRIAPRDEVGNCLVAEFSFLTEGRLVSWTLWHYRTTFARSIISFWFLYLVFIWFYAFIIRATVINTYEDIGSVCITYWDFNSTDFMPNFSKAFELSWTTMSTVGYGTIAVPLASNCTALRIILATEAFIGILYIGFCGAITYSKVSRLHGTARVDFSSAICLQYGSGVGKYRQNKISSIQGNSAPQTLNSRDDEIVRPDDDVLTASTYPFIEIRVVNSRPDGVGGEISNATITCVASSIRFMRSDSSSDIRSDSPHGSESEGKQQDDFEGLFSVQHAGRDDVSVPSLKRTFQTIKVTPDSHPYFTQGSWNLRHQLDQKSPLLKPSIRRVIREIGGWPTYLNDPVKIRKCLSSDIFSIHIIFTGTSNVTASSCFKIYEYKISDIFIGWRFVNMAYIDETDPSKDKKCKFDLSLIHDIIPQHGGGAESLESRDSL